MKAIISHDIDHITVWEHLFRDSIVPKYIARMHIEFLNGKISSREYTLRWSDLIKNKWQNIDELITFNNYNHVPNSFFIAVNKGVGLNYSNASAKVWIEQMKMRKCEIGIHGIAFENATDIKKEHDLFSKLTEQNHFGIRMHYVRTIDRTFELLNQCGYLYDSTVHDFKNPYKIGNMWEFPFQIMDGWIIENYKPWQSLNLKQAKENTRKIVDISQEKNLNYFVVDFHDRYFSHAFKTWLDWYMWLIEYLREQKIEFINFKNAIGELEKSKF